MSCSSAESPVHEGDRELHVRPNEEPTEQDETASSLPSTNKCIHFICAAMDLVMDRLSVILLGGISVLAVVHLVLLRKPDPATHPLILGRQSDVDKVGQDGTLNTRLIS